MSRSSDTQPVQVIDGHYLDPAKLMNLLKITLGSSDGGNNFRVELMLNRYNIYYSGNASESNLLSEEQILDCRKRNIRN
ncbi:hypothetical protein K469DRAFT_707664 [Zopfia rhizophila CBS 207.26]|uniref:Uncharacterized protein n=1 Tax=Zopfia rhizophila CBS 207.26 TaxID=1314779 RepID=A0A6A6E485_9PEZI|nr:hypothetical protein K469DRAFT_707664 [Zopfia rhizophila CBS 207.26]